MAEAGMLSTPEQREAATHSVTEVALAGLFARSQGELEAWTTKLELLAMAIVGPYQPVWEGETVNAALVALLEDQDALRARFFEVIGRPCGTLPTGFTQGFTR